MADPALAAASALDDAMLPKGRSGAPGDPPGVTVREIVPHGAASVAARRDQAGRLAQAAQALGLDLPSRPGWRDGGGFQAVWTGPGRWLVFGPAGTAATLRAALGDAASVADQSDARLVLHVAGPQARATLAKGVILDLHPGAFGPGDAATTQAARMAVLLWQIDATPAYGLAVARSYAGSLAAWLIGAAAEFGLLVE